MKFIFPKNYNFKPKFLGLIEYSTAIMDVIIAISFVVMLLSILLSLNKFLRPLLEVTKSVTELASDSADLTRKIQVKNKDEIGEVVKGFNLFTDKLRQIIEIYHIALLLTPRARPWPVPHQAPGRIPPPPLPPAHRPAP